MKKIINKNYIIDKLYKVIDNSDEVIIFYSGIWSFINYLDFLPKDIPGTFLNILEEFVGKNRTIVFPAFTSNEFVKTKKFDINLSIPNESGIIPIQAVKSQNYIRTKQPLHSYLAKGPKAYELNELLLSTSWGKESVLEWLSKYNAKICVIGIPWKYGCSYFHRFEELYEVPWRYFKKFNGDLLKDGKYIDKITENKYSSPLGIDFKYDYSPIVKLMSKNDIIKKGNDDVFPIQSSTTSEINQICKKFFENNPWNIVKDIQNVKNWIKESKSKEILDLLK